MGCIIPWILKLLICTGDVGNAFLYGKTRKQVYVIAGMEFGPKIAGKNTIIFKSLYGFKTSSARFNDH